MSVLDSRKFICDSRHGGICGDCGNRIQIIQVVKSDNVYAKKAMNIDCPYCDNGAGVWLYLRTTHIKVNK